MSTGDSGDSDIDVAAHKRCMVEAYRTSPRGEYVQAVAHPDIRRTATVIALATPIPYRVIPLVQEAVRGSHPAV